MKILYTIKEYARLRGLSEVSVYKKVNSNYSKSIKIDKETYIIEDDTIVKTLKQIIQKKNGQIRELKLKIKVKNNSEDERYINELIKQIEDLKETTKEQKEDIKKLLDQKDTMYEKFLGTLVNQKSITS
jgi:seryl-tRNA synthetase